MKIKKGDTVYCLIWGKNPPAQILEAVVTEVLYPGTTHEQIVFNKYDCGILTMYTVKKGYFSKNKNELLHKAHAELFEELAKLRAKAASLGFRLT